ncbi:MAG: GEVED domain-containing protein [Bacteroidota bacterium]
MKKNYPRLILMLPLVFIAAGAAAQSWCTPNTGPAYASTQPGITNFTLNTLNRSSNDLENTSNSYVNTGLSTTLIAGNPYNVTIGYTIDASICPDMNLRVWIDFNQDGQLDDIGETVITSNNQTSLSYTGSFNVPANAMNGTTRLRVTAKMTSNGGHTLPTPCNIPADPLGYHGELEDYTIVITGGVSSIQDFSGIFSNVEIAPNPSSGITGISYSLKTASAVSVELFNMAGEQVAVLSREEQPAGEHHIYFDPARLSMEAGIYFIKLTAGTAVHTKKLAVIK